MLEALDELISKRRLSVLLVYGDSTFGNPELLYVVGASLARGGVYLKRRRKAPILVVSNIDVGAASKGLVSDVRTYSEYGYEKLLAKYGRDRVGPLLFDRILRKHRVTGRIGLHGRNDASEILDLSKQLRRLGHRVVGERHPSLLEAARETKSSLEIDKVRDVGSRTKRVFKKTIEFLEGCKRDEKHLIYESQILRVGIVKTEIRRYLAEENLAAPEDLIFAVGPRSADPHYTGEDGDLVLVDQPIVFDIFPQETGGYYFDMTRTFVIGKSSERIRRMYKSVSTAQQFAFDLAQAGCRAEALMNAVCDHFSSEGYKTIRDLARGDRIAEKIGFVHSLGHGIGLTIGEKPYLTVHSDDNLKVGHVFTVEPGLYDPEVGGVRIEDVVALTDSGMVNLTDCEKILEIGA